MAKQPKPGDKPQSAQERIQSQRALKTDLSGSLVANRLAASTETVTKAKVSTPAAKVQKQPQPKPPGERVTQTSVPTTVKRDPAATPAPKRKASGKGEPKKKREAPPGAKKVGWHPRMIRRFLTGAITLGELEGISKEEQYEMAKVGHRLLRQGKLEPAEQIFKGLVALDTRDAYFHMALGSIAQRNGDLEAAEHSYSASLAINPYSPHALANRGEVRLILGRLVDGAKDLMQAVAEDPKLEQEPTRRALATIQVLKAQLAEQGVDTQEAQAPTTSPKTPAASKPAANTNPRTPAAPPKGPGPRRPPASGKR